MVIEMKRNTWIAIITIITVCCVIGGTFIHIGRFAFINVGTTNLGAGLEGFSIIDIDMDLANVTVTAGDEFYLSCDYTGGLEPLYEVKSGILTVKQKVYRGWGINNRYCSLTLTIPSSAEMDSIDINTALGDINLNGIVSSRCEIQTNAGDCMIKQCSFGETEADTNMGDVSMNDATLGKAEAESDMGEIKVINCTFECLSAETSMGDVSVSATQNLDGYKMDLETSMGSIHVNGQSEGTAYHQSGEDGVLELGTSMGSVKLNYVK